MKALLTLNILALLITHSHGQITTPILTSNFNFSIKNENYTVPIEYYFILENDDKKTEVKAHIEGNLDALNHRLPVLLEKSISDSELLTFDCLEAKIYPEYPNIVLRARVRFKIWITSKIKGGQDTGWLILPLSVQYSEDQIGLNIDMSKVQYQEFGRMTEDELNIKISELSLNAKLPKTIYEQNLKILKAEFKEVNGGLGVSIIASLSFDDLAKFNVLQESIKD